MMVLKEKNEIWEVKLRKFVVGMIIDFEFFKIEINIRFIVSPTGTTDI